MSGAYYNENDPFAAAWLRELVKAGHIAPGEVDERSIVDVRPHEVKAFTQCHWFAGIGVWSHALRAAGWDDDRPVWSGSCPCQPFSASGRGAGFADERHLWPHWFHLIAECRPSVIVGEQVASKDGLNWLDLVYLDMEAAGYACGTADLCAAGVGGPHIRQRLFFVGKRLEHAEGDGRREWRAESGQRGAVARRGADRLADADSAIAELASRPGAGAVDAQGAGAHHQPDGRGEAGGLGDGVGARLEGHAGNGDASGQSGWFGTPPPRPVAATGGADRLADTARRVDPDQRQRDESENQSRASFEFGPVVGTGGGNGDGDGAEGSAAGRSGGGGETGADGIERLADAGQGGREVVAATRLHGRRDGAGGDEAAEGNPDRPSGHDAARRGEPVGLADAESPSTGTGLRDRGSREERRLLVADDLADSGLADADQGQRRWLADGQGCERDGTQAGWLEGDGVAESGGTTHRLADAGSGSLRNEGRGSAATAPGGTESVGPERQWLWTDNGSNGAVVASGQPGPSPVNGYWRAADWLFCRDGKWRPVEPGTFPLASGTAGRVGLLRGYGNSLCAPVAQTFIEAVIDILEGDDIG